MDQGLLEGFVDNRAQGMHMHQQGVLVTGIVLPYLAKDISLQDNVGRMTHQQGQYPQGNRRQHQHLASTFEAHRPGIETKIGNAEHRSIAVATGTTDQGADTCIHFAQRDRLDHVIIGADIEHGDLDVNIILRSQHHHRRLAIQLAPIAVADGESVDPRQVEIQHDQVEMFARQQGQRRLAVGGQRHGMAAEAEVIDQIAGKVTIVFDDHFDGDSGGVPEGWHVVPGDPGYAVEAGTTVTLYDDIRIITDSLVEPFEGTVVITTDIAQTETEFGIGTFVASPDISSYFGSSLYVSSGMVEVVAADVEGGEQR